MDKPYTLYRDLPAEAPVPPRGILSQTLWRDRGAELVLFAFAPGERLSEHTASRPAIIHFLSGDAELRVGDETIDAMPGTWLAMPPDTRHAVTAHTAVLMALYLLEGGSD